MTMLAVWLAATTAAVGGQGGELPAIETSVVPETVTVGSRFVYRVSVRTTPGVGVVFPQVLDTTGVVTSVTPAQVRSSGDTLWAAEFEGAAWEPGRHRLPPVAVTLLVPGDSTRVVEASGPEVVVRSVLPANAEAVEPRGPKDVWGGNWTVWEWGLAALAAAALLGLALYAGHRLRSRKPAVPAVSLDPKVVALSALATLEDKGAAWLVDGDAKAYYTQLSQILRYYLQALNPTWSPDLTTAELLLRLRLESVSGYHAFELADILGEADLVKFAPVRPLARDAVTLTERAREWVEAFELPEPELAEVVADAGSGPAAPTADGEGDR